MKFLNQTAQTNWKLFAVITIVAIILVLAGILIIRVREQNEFRDLHEAEFFERQKEEQRKLSTEGWQTYRSDEFGYSLQIPPAWISRNFEGKSRNFEVAFGEGTGVFRFVGENDDYKMYDLCNVISIASIPSKFTIDGFAQEVLGFRSELENAERTEIQISSQKAIHFEHRTQDLFDFTTFVKNGDLAMTITGRSCKEETKFILLSKQILSSIQFTRPKTSLAIPQQSIDTKDWPLYTNPTFGYSLKMPPSFDDVAGDDVQKRFHIHSYKTVQEEPGLSRGFCNEFHCPNALEVVEIQILTLSYDNPAVSKSPEELKSFFKKAQELSPGEELYEEGRVYLKIQNLELNGCIAPQVFFENQYLAFCVGNNRYISFILEADREKDLEELKPSYDAALSTFRFNQFTP